ncbi:MAG: 30S ribosomal protein S8 [Acidobacteria bacterium]|nr:30S ribosomal protein S8 [Acidobacteriota bacterium]
MITDPIADMLSRIRNAAHARLSRTDMPASRMKIELAKILKEEGYLSSYKVVEENKHKVLRITLKFTPDKRSVITDMRRVSKPGCRVYIGKKEIRSVVGGLGTAILTTPRGVMTGRAAKKAGVGGEFLCEIW